MQPFPFLPTKIPLSINSTICFLFQKIELTENYVFCFPQIHFWECLSKKWNPYMPLSTILRKKKKRGGYFQVWRVLRRVWLRWLIQVTKTSSENHKTFWHLWTLHGAILALCVDLYCFNSFPLGRYSQIPSFIIYLLFQ